MKYKVFIDGKEGTTGLRIYDRLAKRTDIELMLIPENKRKDLEERKKYINNSDITFLCLPDASAIEAVGLVTNDKTRIIDASTAHRTNPEIAINNFMSNAGHTCVLNDGTKIMTQHLPTSLVSSNTTLIIGPGAAITPHILFNEIIKYADLIGKRNIIINPA